MRLFGSSSSVIRCGLTLACALAPTLMAKGDSPSPANPQPFIEVAPDGRIFQQAGGAGPFTPWGFNYDHDRDGRLIEDYWQSDWPVVAEDFREMKALGANVVRVHLQFGRFMKGPREADSSTLRQFAKLLALAEETGLYLDVTGLGCYHKKDVPPWYDAMDETERWGAQAAFWEAVAAVAAPSPAVFCYDLMNEPVAPAGKSATGDWLGPPFGGKHFVQRISLDQAGRERPAVARAWIDRLVTAIRLHDAKHLITVGLVDWSLERPGLQSGFVPSKVAARLDFIAVHLYPKDGRRAEDLETLAGFAAVGKPVVVEETFPLGCSMENFAGFVKDATPRVGGWIGFYWGQRPDELDPTRSIGEALTKGWLEFFVKSGPPGGAARR